MICCCCDRWRRILAKTCPSRQIIRHICIDGGRRSSSIYGSGSNLSLQRISIQCGHIETKPKLTERIAENLLNLLACRKLMPVPEPVDTGECSSGSCSSESASITGMRPGERYHVLWQQSKCIDSITRCFAGPARAAGCMRIASHESVKTHGRLRAYQRCSTRRSNLRR